MWTLRVATPTTRRTGGIEVADYEPTGVFAHVYSLASDSFELCVGTGRVHEVKHGASGFPAFPAGISQLLKLMAIQVLR